MNKHTLEGEKYWNKKHPEPEPKKEIYQNCTCGINTKHYHWEKNGEYFTKRIDNMEKSKS